MTWVFFSFAIALAGVFLWGVFAPQSQWRALSAWSLSDVHAHEPGGTAYGWRRVISALGALGMIAVAAVSSGSALAVLPAQAAPAPSAITRMWGAPNPMIIDRVVTPLVAAPDGFVQQPIAAYQTFDADDGLPDYLDGLELFKYLGKLDFSGYIGTIPDVGFSALDFADLVVQVRAPVLCVPRQAVVIESATDVKIAIFYGAPDPAGGPVPDNTVACAGDPSVTSSVLIPISLSSPVGDRAVTTLDGTALDAVTEPEAPN